MTTTELLASPILGSPPPLEAVVAHGRTAAMALLDERWDELNARAPLGTPTLASRWLKEVVAFEPGEPLLVAVESDGELACAGAFRVRRLGGLLRPRIARTLGIGLATLSHAFLVDDTVSGAVPVLVERLFDEIDVVLIDCPSDDEVLPELLDRLPWARAVPTIEGWRVPLPPPRLDHARRRANHELRHAARVGARVTVAVAEEPVEVAAALERLLALHRERWRGRRDFVGLFSSTADQREFHRAAVRVAAERGCVRLAEVVEDGHLVGSSMVLVDEGTAVCSGLAVRPGGTLRGPGHVALLTVVEAATKAGATELDLGRGNGSPRSPKHRLGATEIPFVSLLGARSPRMQRLFESAFSLRDAARARGRRPPRS